MSRFIDGDFSFARETEGSGVRTFSQYNTGDFILERQFAQLPTTYKPLAISSPDSVFKKAYLVEESVVRIDAYLTYFRRTYMTIPSNRLEHRNVTLTIPGESLYAVVTIAGKATATFDRYGKSRPATVFRSAEVDYSYSLGEVPVDTPTQVVFNGQPVDFVGLVYSDDAQTFQGTTTPINKPGFYVISDVCRRFRGDIWERERITVTEGGSSSFIPTP